MKYCKKKLQIIKSQIKISNKLQLNRNLLAKLYWYNLYVILDLVQKYPVADAAIDENPIFAHGP